MQNRTSTHRINYGIPMQCYTISTYHALIYAIPAQRVHVMNASLNPTVSVQSGSYIQPVDTATAWLYRNMLS